jgi:peptidyl-tRNA hydrolase
MKASSKRPGREKKITVQVPTDLLAAAQKASNAGISETVRKGLEALVARWAYDGLLKMRGKVKMSIDLDELRKDKDRAGFNK